MVMRTLRFECNFGLRRIESTKFVDLPDGVFGAVSTWIRDSPRPLQNPQDVVDLLNFKLARIAAERQETVCAEVVTAVRDLEGMLPNEVSIEGVFAHTRDQEAPHHHAYYQRRFLPSQAAMCALA